MSVNSDKIKMGQTVGMTETEMSCHWIKKGGAPRRVLRVSYLNPSLSPNLNFSILDLTLGYLGNGLGP